MRSRRGQIVVPAMFILPTLFIFVYLIFETAKLSRIKIRHQFAVDAAAFVEMTNYSDFLNRSAYVNGAFPMRIFYEGFSGTTLDCMGKTNCPGPTKLSEILYTDGVYPRSQTNPNPDQYQGVAANAASWDIRYHAQGSTGGAARGQRMNQLSPEPASPDCTANGTSYPNCVVIVGMNTAKFYNVNWEDANQIYKLYVQIFQLLGSVESAQFSVLKRLQADHNFLTKSYWLNTGGANAQAEAGELKSNFSTGSGSKDKWQKDTHVRFHCVKHVLFHGNQLVHTWGQPYQIWASDPPPEMPKTIDDCDSGGNLFQVVTVKKDIVKSMREKNGGNEYPGWPVYTRYALDPNNPGRYENYFNIDLQTLLKGVDDGPRVRTTVAVGGFHGMQPAVWAEGESGQAAPTPKFQVRQYP